MSKVDHPEHYNAGKIEVIDFIEDQQLDFSLGNAVKYICRAGRKSSETRAEDLEKAVWYLQDKIRRIRPQEPETVLEDWVDKYRAAMNSIIKVSGVDSKDCSSCGNFDEIKGCSGLACYNCVAEIKDGVMKTPSGWVSKEEE